jgi:ribose 5-phosphate isomerase A
MLCLFWLTEYGCLMTFDPVRESHKRAAAARAVDYVKDGMKLGIGTGTTAEAFMDALAPRLRDGLKIVGTATSKRTEEKARALGIILDDLDKLAPLDLTVDGTDEADHDLNLIKGGGGALLREKIVAASSRRMIVIAEDAKLVPKLGRFPLPIEVVPFAHGTTARRIAAVAHSLGHPSLTPVLRTKEYAPFVTDNGNHIYDCAFGAIANVPILAVALSTVPGVVEHGLFVGLASMLILGGEAGVRVIERKS